MEQLKEESGDALSDAQLEKLNLEIQSLRSKNRWEDRVARYIPLITVVIAVGGFLAGIMQFQKQQRAQQDLVIIEQEKSRSVQDRDLKIRIQNQIRTDIDQLLQFTKDQQQSISRALFLLKDLNTLTADSDPLSSNQTSSFLLSDYRRTITHALIKLIHYDCNFLKNPRDVYFTTTVFDHWKDYSDYLKEDTKELDFLLYKYLRALRDLHDKNPKYFEQIQYDKLSSRYVVLFEDYNEENQFQHYGDTVVGFMKHLDILEGSSDLKEGYFQDFQRALCNAVLTEQLFGKSFPDDCSNSKSTYSLRNKNIDDQPQVFLPSAVRGPNASNDVVLRDSIKSFIVLVALEGSHEYETYRATIRTSDGRVAWRKSALRLQPSGVLTIGLNSASFRSGNHNLMIEGIDREGHFLVIADYPFRVIRRIG